MSLISEVNRITQIRNNIRTKLIALNMIQDPSSTLDDCVDSLQEVAARTSQDITKTDIAITVPAGYYNQDVDISVVQYTCVLPQQEGTLIYSGSDQSPTWDVNYDSTKLTLSGTTSGNNAGSYTATFTPKEGYGWSDGTRDSKNQTWSISKATGFISVSSSISLVTDNTANITVNANHGGTITGEDTTLWSVGTYSGGASGGYLPITAKLMAGQGTLTITCGATQNYTSASTTCNVSVSWPSSVTITMTGDWYPYPEGLLGGSSAGIDVYRGSTSTTDYYYENGTFTFKPVTDFGTIVRLYTSSGVSYGLKVIDNVFGTGTQILTDEEFTFSTVPYNITLNFSITALAEAPKGTVTITKTS